MLDSCTLKALITTQEVILVIALSFNKGSEMVLHISCESSKMMLHISCESSHDNSQEMWSIISLGCRKLKAACWYFKAALYGQWKVVNIQEQRSAYGHRETIIKGLLSKLLPLGLICHRYMHKASHVSILYRHNFKMK